MQMGRSLQDIDDYLTNVKLILLLGLPIDLLQKGRGGEISRSKTMTYNAVKHLKPTEFKRLSGVRPETFESMLTVLRQAQTQKPPGRPSKLSLEDQ